MKAIWGRLQDGERWWAAEIGVRLTGIALLVVCVTASWWLYRTVPAATGQPRTALDFATATSAVVSFSLGSAFTIEGPALFRSVPMPPRTLLP